MEKIMKGKIVRYGIFGDEKANFNDDGTIDIPVIIQASGLFAGAPPLELRIHEMGVYEDDDFNKRYVAELNRETYLPFYLAKARVKILPGLEKWTDEKLLREGLKPLEKKIKGVE